MTNPFQYQRPLRPEAVIDRDSEVQRLLDGTAAGTMFRIDAPRRYGKTSLVRKTYAEAANDGTVGVLVDFKGVLTLNDIIVRIGRGYAQLRTPMGRWLRKTLQGIELDFNISILGTGAGVKLTQRSGNDEGALFALLDLPNKIAEQGVRRLIVCFDEFQDVLQVEAADDKMRSSIQHHDEFVSYLFTGSEPRLMRQLFESKRRAFWDQAEPLKLQPLVGSDVLTYIAAQFAETGKDVGDVGARLVSVADGHPQRAMFLANKLWQHTPSRGTANDATWEAAFTEAMLQEESAFDAEWRSIDPTAEQRVLRAIALYDGRPHRNEAARAVGVARGSVGTVVKNLQDRYLIRPAGDKRVAFVDPLFGIYVAQLAQQLPLPSIPDADEDQLKV